MNPFSTLRFSEIPASTPLTESFHALLPQEPRIDRFYEVPEEELPAGAQADLHLLACYRKRGFWRQLADLARDRVRVLSITQPSGQLVSKIPIEQWVDLRLESLFKLKYYDALARELGQVADIYGELLDRPLPFPLQFLQALLPAVAAADCDLAIVKLKRLADADGLQNIDRVLQCYEWMVSFLVAQKCEPVGIELYEDLKTRVKHKDIYCILGKLYLQVNERAKAAEIFDEFETLFPPSGSNLMHILTNRSLLAIYNCQYDESLQYVEQQLAIQQDHIEAHNQLALVKLYTGQPIQALDLLEKTVADYPALAAQHSSLLSNLFQLYELVLDRPLDSKLAILKVLLPYLADDFNASALVSK